MKPTKQSKPPTKMAYVCLFGPASDFKRPNIEKIMKLVRYMIKKKALSKKGTEGLKKIYKAARQELSVLSPSTKNTVTWSWPELKKEEVK